MTIGVSSVGGGADQLALAKQAKLDPDRDMTISALGSGEAMRWRCRAGGSTASAPPPREEAVRKYGAHPMITTGAGEVKALDGFVYIGVIVRESWLQKNQDLAVRFLRGSAVSRRCTIRRPPRSARGREGEVLCRVGRGVLQRDLGCRQPSYPKTIALSPEMVERIVNFVNETTPEPLDKKSTESGWTNEYAAKRSPR